MVWLCHKYPWPGEDLKIKKGNRLKMVTFLVFKVTGRKKMTPTLIH